MSKLVQKTKNQIASPNSRDVAALIVIAVERLFVHQRWLANKKQIARTRELLIRYGFLRASKNGWRITPLGDEWDVCAWMTFLGHFHDSAAIVPELGDLLTDSDLEQITVEPSSDPEIALKPYVRKAFVRYLSDRSAKTA